MGVRKLFKAIIPCMAGVVFASGASRAPAAEFEILRVPQYDNVIVIMTGEIVRGDGSRFAEVVESLEGAHATVSVQGPGGLLDEALDIGSQIRLAGFATMVLPKAECFSACALIWLAGVRRYLAADSVIGVHAAFRTDELGGVSESGVDNADIGAYLANLGLPRTAIRYVTLASPDTFLPITPDIARRLGIEVYEQDGLNTITPDDAPTVHALVRKVTELMAVSLRCAELLSLDADKARIAAETVLDQAHDSFGSDTTAEILPWITDETKAAIESAGILRWCVEATFRLTREGFDVGLDGPSFDCGRAVTSSEHAICDEPMLWALDRAVSLIYGVLAGVAKAEERTALKASQRSWIEWRDGCGAEVTCLEEAYYKRLLDFGTREGWKFRY